MQTFPAEPVTPGSLCSQQKQALLGHDSSALFSTSVLLVMNCNQDSRACTITGFIQLSPNTLYLEMCPHPPASAHMWFLPRPTVVPAGGTSLAPWKVQEGTRCLRACMASHVCLTKVVTSKISELCHVMLVMNSPRWSRFSSGLTEVGILMLVPTVSYHSLGQRGGCFSALVLDSVSRLQENLGIRRTLGG